MQRFLLAVLALVALVAAIVVVAPGLIPVAAYKGRVEAAATQALGRKVSFGDDLRFKLVPQTAFHVTELEVANAEGFEAPYLAHVKAADIGVKLMPLLKGSVEIDRFILTEPDINLARAKDGSVNWNLASSDTPQASGAATRDVKLGDVRIVDGKASFSDAAAKKAYAFDDIDAAVTLKSLMEPLEVDGSFKFQGTPSKAKLVLTSLSKMMAKESAGMKLDLVLGEATASADLVVETKDQLAYSGPVALNAPNLPAFARMMGTPLQEAPGFDKLAIKGESKGGPNTLRLTGADIDFDAIDAAGDVTLAWGGARPKATGRLNVGKLDLRPYLPPPPAGAQGFPAWSEAKIDFASLRNIDAELDISAEQIFLNDLTFGESRMKLKIDDGRMTAEIPELGMYGGAGSGQLVVNARQATPSITGKFDVGSVQAEPFTKDLMKIDKLLGLGGFNMEFSASGASQAAIMRSLDGKGGFDVADGAIKGVNLGKLAAAVDQIRKGGINPTAISNAIAAAQRPDEKTDFSEFLSEFGINNGFATAPSISLKGPFVTMTGKGDVNLPAQTLDLRLAPVATTSIDGEGGRRVAIPVRVTGTFSQPKISVDVEALLRGSLERGLTDFLGKALQKDQPADESGAAEEEPDPARDILDVILGPSGQKSGVTPRAGGSPGAGVQPGGGSAAPAPLPAPTQVPAPTPEEQPAASDPQSGAEIPPAPEPVVEPTPEPVAEPTPSAEAEPQPSPDPAAEAPSPEPPSEPTPEPGSDAQPQ